MEDIYISGIVNKDIIRRKYIAIIPARGGSKRLPGKNSKLFAGMPLIAYTIRYAQLQKEISTIAVTTDDSEIKKIAISMGVDVIDRPEYLSGDTATTASALKHVLECYNNNNIHFERVVTLQPTNPLRPEFLFDDCAELFDKHHYADSVIAVSRTRMKMGTIDRDYYIPSNYTPGQRSQDLVPLYYENGLLYITNSDIVVNNEDVFGQKVLACEVDEQFPEIDIDEQIDFDWGEFIYKKYSNTFSYLL
jgi:N-acylneuraminate cytidylyltransferase